MHKSIPGSTIFSLCDWCFSTTKNLIGRHGCHSHILQHTVPMFVENNITFELECPKDEHITETKQGSSARTNIFGILRYSIL